MSTDASAVSVDVPLAPVIRSMSIKTDTAVGDEYKSSTAAILMVCGQALKQLGDQPFTKSNIISTLHTIMEVVETVQLAAGVNKKQLALDCVHWLINQQANLLDADKAFLINIVDFAAPAAIDVMVSISKGPTALNAKVKSCC